MKKNNENSQYIENFPFLTLGIFDEEELLGIVQNIKENYIYIYVFNLIKSQKLKQKFIEYGGSWWWESNRSIPINIFLGDKFVIFKDYLRVYNTKNFKILYCPNLNYLKTKKNRKVSLSFL